MQLCSCAPTSEFIQTRILHFLQRLESNPAILVSHIWTLSEVFLGHRPLVVPRSTSKGLIWLWPTPSFLRRSVRPKEDSDFFWSGHDGCQRAIIDGLWDENNAEATWKNFLPGFGSLFMALNVHKFEPNLIPGRGLAEGVKEYLSRRRRRCEKTAEGNLIREMGLNAPPADAAINTSVFNNCLMNKRTKNSDESDHGVKSFTLCTEINFLSQGTNLCSVQKEVVKV